MLITNQYLFISVTYVLLLSIEIDNVIGGIDCYGEYYKQIF